MEAPAMDGATALSELVNLKAKIEHENTELLEQHDQLREQLAEIQLEKESLRSYNGEMGLQIIQAKLENIAKSNMVAPVEDHVKWQRSLLAELEVSIGEHLGLLPFEKVISNLRDMIDGALTFYSEDSLHYELTKRSEENRNMRVELTRITAEVEEKKRAIEEKKAAAEAARLAEIKRREEEEQRNKRLEEERAMAEKMKQREQFLMQQKSVQPQLPPFRTVSFNGCSPEPRQSFSSSNGRVSPAGSVKDFGPSAVTTNTPVTAAVAKPTSRLLPSFPTFSQLTRW